MERASDGLNRSPRSAGLVALGEGVTTFGSDVVPVFPLRELPHKS